MPNSLPYGREPLRKSDAYWKIGPSVRPEVLPEAVDLMHALVQDDHDPDVAIREMTPVDEMALAAKEEPFDAELGRYGL